MNKFMKILSAILLVSSAVIACSRDEQVAATVPAPARDPRHERVRGQDREEDCVRRCAVRSPECVRVTLQAFENNPSDIEGAVEDSKLEFASVGEEAIAYVEGAPVFAISRGRCAFVR